MERRVSLEEITDGKLYQANDLVKADTGDCRGCSACCHEMVETIVLDPLDLVRMTEGSGYSFQKLLEKGMIRLEVTDGMILPHLAVNPQTGGCSFLNKEGRCTIHTKRPGFCRLFPLGRYYHDRTFSYILQIHECKKTNLTKIKVKKWLGEADLPRYEAYANTWHYFLKGTQKSLAALPESNEEEKELKEKLTKQVSMAILQLFFVHPWPETISFYEEFENRFRRIRAAIADAGIEMIE